MPGVKGGHGPDPVGEELPHSGNRSKHFVIDLFYTVSVSERRLLPVLKDRGQNRRTEG